MVDPDFTTEARGIVLSGMFSPGEPPPGSVSDVEAVLRRITAHVWRQAAALTQTFSNVWDVTAALRRKGDEVARG